MQHDGGLCLLLKKDPVTLDVLQAVRVPVDKEDRLKFDPTCFEGFVVWRDVMSMRCDGRCGGGVMSACIHGIDMSTH